MASLAALCSLILSNSRLTANYAFQLPSNICTRRLHMSPLACNSRRSLATVQHRLIRISDERLLWNKPVSKRVTKCREIVNMTVAERVRKVIYVYIHIYVLAAAVAMACIFIPWAFAKPKRFWNRIQMTYQLGQLTTHRFILLRLWFWNNCSGLKTSRIWQLPIGWRLIIR